MKHTFHRALALFCAIVMLLGCFTWPVFAADVDNGDTPSGTMQVGGVQKSKWTILDATASGGQDITTAAGARWGFTKASLGIDLPDSMTMEGLGLYLHFELDAADAALLNSAGDAQIELAQTKCDNSEITIQCRTATTWVAGENKVLIPFGTKASPCEGSTGPFDLHETINHFRIYSVVASEATTIKVYEVAIVDIGGVDMRSPGSNFGEGGDTYLQMESALTTAPSSFEASIKMDSDIVKYKGMWEVGLPGNGRYGNWMTTITGTTSADDTPANIAYKEYQLDKYSGTETTSGGKQVAADGYFGTADYKFAAITIPEKYTKDDLALAFWVCWEPSVSGTPFNLYSYIELTSSGKSDTNELCWGTNRAEFTGMKEGWNYIVLPFSGATVAGGDIDLSNINFFRIWGSTSLSYTMSCDSTIRMSTIKIIAMEEQEEQETTDEATSWSLGLPGAMRTTAGSTTPTATVDGKYYDSKNPVTGTATAEDEATYGIPAGTNYIGGTVMGGYEYEYATGETDDEGNPIMAISNRGGGSVGFAGKDMNTVSVPTTYTESDLALVFWFYTSTGSLGCEGKYPDVETSSAGYFQLELTSSGTSDKEESMFSNTHAGFANVQPGWNLIVLPLDKPSERAGNLNLQNINYVRWISAGTMPEDVTIYVSEMSIVAYSEVEDTYEYWRLGPAGGARTDASIYKMTAKTGTVTAQEAIAYDMPYNIGWTGGTVPVGGNFGLAGCWSTLNFPNPNEYAIADLDLVFWLYTSTGELADSKFYFELSNEGGDNRELYWSYTHAAFQNLQVGWNKIVLPMREAAKEGTDAFTLDEPIKYTRVHGTGSATVETEIYVTDLYIVAHNTPAHTIVDGHETWRLSDFAQSNRNWDGATQSFGNVWTNDGTDALQPADGTVYMKVSPNGDRVTVTTGGESKSAWKAGFNLYNGAGMMLPEISSTTTLDNLVFSFWMYVPDADLIPTDISGMPNFQLCSNDPANYDGKCLSHSSLFGTNLQDGWNYIEMPLSAMKKNGDFDITNLNYVRMTNVRVLSSENAADEYIYFADFRLTSTVTISELSDASTVDTTEIYTILSTNDSTDANPIALFVNYDGNPGFFWGDKAFVATDYCAITDEWVDLALTFDEAAATFTMYANGEVIAIVNAGEATAIVPTVGFAVGADVDGSNLLNGMIADVRIWSDVRTADEIANNRIADKNAFGAVDNGLDETTEGLIGAWTLVGGIDYVLEKKPDLSASNIALVYRGSRYDDWDLDYQIPEEIGDDYYTIVFIPDTQNLVTGKYNDEFYALTEWISENIEEENIVHVIGAGDTTWNDTVPEYERAIKGWNMFTDKVSWSNMIGNHDYPWKSNTMLERDTTNYESYFGIDYINKTMGAQNYAGSFDDPYGVSTTENSYYRFQVNGVQWMILQIEYHPRVSVINWANEIAAQYPDDNIILTTHGYIGGDNAAYSTHWMTYTANDVNVGGYIGSLMDPPVEWNFSTFTGASDKSSELPIWTELIAKNDNIKMLLCGHASTTDGHVLARWDENEAGNTVPQIMINAQDVDEDYFEDYAMGMIGLLRFSADGTKMDIQYYSPYHDASYHPSNDHMRSFDLNLNGEAEEEEVTATEGLVFTLNADKQGYTVTDYIGTATDVTVPATYEGLPVTAYAIEQEITYDEESGALVLPDNFFDPADAPAQTVIENLTFVSKDIVITDSPATIPDTAKIHGYAKSTAAKYADKYGLDFVFLPDLVGVKVQLDSNVGLLYSAYVDETQIDDAVMKFTINGNTKTVTGVATEESGKYTFALTGIGPHMMGDNVSAELIVGGKTIEVLNNYSVKQYGLNMLNKIEKGELEDVTETQAAALRTLIADMLEYGAKAQTYVGHKPLVLVNEGITGASEYVALDSSYATQAPAATTAADGSKFVSVTALLSDVVTLRFTFVADPANIDNVTVTLGGTAYTKEDFTDLGASTTAGLNTYTVATRGLLASELDYTCAAVLTVNGEDCQSFNYGLPNYIYKMQNSTNTKLADLVKAIRNYGLSAVAYRDAK